MVGRPIWGKPVQRFGTTLYPRQREFVNYIAKRDGVSYSCAIRRIIDYAIDCGGGTVPTMEERIRPIADKLMEKLEAEDDGHSDAQL